jgi:hypothetical protein
MPNKSLRKRLTPLIRRSDDPRLILPAANLSAKACGWQGCLKDDVRFKSKATSADNQPCIQPIYRDDHLH